MANIICLLLIQLYLVSFFSLTNAQYNVQQYGARSDRRTDSAQPFLRAWNAACRSSSPATIEVPRGSFLISQVTFKGPCRNSNIKFSIDGELIALLNYEKSGSRWIEFDNVDGVSIEGGIIDGRGEALWSCKLNGGNCPFGTTSLLFSDSKNIEIVGLTSRNSQLYHIVFLGCQHVKVVGVNIGAPGNSPNTDGVHVERSSDVTIAQTNIKTGDDCVSVGQGTSGLTIERVFCGPGHGISIGSLGKEDSEEGVQNVIVKSTVFSGTMNGLRIKTWGTGTKSFVNGVTFEDAVMHNVQNPIIIDQNYCPNKNGCPNQSSHVKISNVKYVNIRGTSATQDAVNFDCSASNPCSGITMEDIKLTYQNQAARSFCKNADGKASGYMVPSNCL